MGNTDYEEVKGYGNWYVLSLSTGKIMSMGFQSRSVAEYHALDQATKSGNQCFVAHVVSYAKPPQSPKATIVNL